MQSWEIEKNPNYMTYAKLWNLEKSNFANLMFLLCEYCGYGKSYTFSRSYANQVKKIVDIYTGYAKTSPKSIVFCVEFVFLHLLELIPVPQTHKQKRGEFAAILEVVFDKTGCEYKKNPAGTFNLIMKKCNGDKFEKILNSLRECCLIHPNIEITQNEKYTDRIQNIIQQYDGANGHLAKHRQSLVCTTEYLLYQVDQAVPDHAINTKYMLECLFKENGIDVKFGEKIVSILKTMNNLLIFNNWIDLINNILFYESEKEQMIKSAYDAGWITSFDFIKHCINVNKQNDTIDAIENYDESHLEVLFNLAIDNKSYVIARHLKNKINDLSVEEIYPSSKLSDFQIFKKLCLDSFWYEEKYIQSTLLDHLISNYKKEIKENIKFTTKFYLDNFFITNKNEEALKKRYLDNFTVDSNFEFFESVIRRYTNNVIHLIEDKKLDLININWQWNGFCNIAYSTKKPYDFFVTPVQGYIIHYVEKCIGSVFQLDLERFLKTIVSSCNYDEIFRKDGKGRDILFYLRKVIDIHNEKKIELIPSLAEAITLVEAKKIEHIKSKFIFFLFGRSDSGSTVPWNMPTEIIRTMADIALESEGIEWQPKVSNGK